MIYRVGRLSGFNGGYDVFIILLLIGIKIGRKRG